LRERDKPTGLAFGDTILFIARYPIRLKPMDEQLNTTESDARFPSGPWKGFFMYSTPNSKCPMELRLQFSNGRMSGDGRDVVGAFSVDGTYDLETGQCNWDKQYHGRHTVQYRGFNEGKGIWGTWRLISEGYVFRGGFHIWPEGMSDPTKLDAAEEADEPIELVPPKKTPRRRRQKRPTQQT